MSMLQHVPESLKRFLEEHGAIYEVILHPRDYSAQLTAADTHTPGREFAKCVLVWIDSYYAMVVIPADHRVDLRLLREALGADHIGLVREEEMLRLFPDCELGAEPPFGNLYDLPVYVAKEIAEDNTITFNAGSHDEALRMPFGDFKRMVDPIVVDCARPE